MHENENENRLPVLLQKGTLKYDRQKPSPSLRVWGKIEDCIAKQKLGTIT